MSGSRQPLYYHKLVNFHKRIEKMELPDEYKQEYLSAVQEHMAIEKLRSEQAREDYLRELVECTVCHKSILRNSFYKHKRNHSTSKIEERNRELE